MHIWKTKELISDLSTDKLSQWDMTQYLIATTTLWYVLGGIYYDPTHESAIIWLTNIMSAVIAGIGIYYCYTVNRQFSEKDFIVRFTVLSWPASIRWIIITLVFYLLIASVLGNYSSTFSNSEAFINTYLLIAEVLYFWMLSYYIKTTGEYGKQI